MKLSRIFDTSTGPINDGPRATTMERVLIVLCGMVVGFIAYQAYLQAQSANRAELCSRWQMCDTKGVGQ